MGARCLAWLEPETWCPRQESNLMKPEFGRVRQNASEGERDFKSAEVG